MAILNCNMLMLFFQHIFHQSHFFAQKWGVHKIFLRK